MTTKRLDCDLKIKSVSETGEFSGYGSVFGVKDSHHDIVIKGAFSKSLKAWSEKGKLPALLWQHKPSEPIGVYTKMIEDENGLYFEGRLLIDDDPLAKRAYAHMKAGSLTGFSIGYKLNDYEWDKDKSAFILKEIDLKEVSLVTFPSNEDAQLTDIKTTLSKGGLPNHKHIEAHLKGAGFNDEQLHIFMKHGYDAVGDMSNSEILKKLQTLSNKIGS